MARTSRTSRTYREYSSREEKPVETTIPPHASSSRPPALPQYNHNGHEVTPGIKPEGESGRKGIHPLKFLMICFRSSSNASKYVNVLWPLVPVAIVLHFARPDLHLAIFITNYLAMIPAANLIGFAGQELARKLPHVLGVILETTLGSIVEIVLFMVLIKTSNGNSNVQVIKAAILGSILANMLLCLGLCFIAGGMRREEQSFHPAISEAGSGLMLVAGMGLIIPAAFSHALVNNPAVKDLEGQTLKITRATAVILLVAYIVFVFYQTKSHDNLYGEIFEADEHKDEDRHRDMKKAKLTLTECIVALTISITCVSLIAVFLVLQIHNMVHEHHISDAFVGLILIPLVEKAAEHLTAIDEAWDNQMNFALAHVLGASIQTALLNTPLVILVGWGLHVEMDMKFEIFDSIVLILAILVVGSFLRDGKSNYLEGTLCVFVYIIIAVSAWHYPDPEVPQTSSSHTTPPAEGGHRMF
ncbi:hypothetical protein GQ43DRAFT_414867 [Delitschia confertaspora ATCC 74209]|uniref:Vacuolar calcium ion transporter n=1 Tax=Delitschia confertaspora ATCC 74209 TaxID=1513339 RepID=A0A9P4MW75_9PLEO|nr:hypothetical protein GQ43DRAFT_414867 [Delitschia confertaspora ATCC 74209]